MRISKTVAVAVVYAGCAGTIDSTAATGNFGPEALNLINSYRVSHGVSPLASNGTLKALARQHSQYQAARDQPRQKLQDSAWYVQRTLVTTIGTRGIFFLAGAILQPIGQICFDRTCGTQEFP